MTSWTESTTSQPLFQNTFILRRPKVAIFADIIKIATMFVKTIFKDSKKLKELEIMCDKMQSISVFLDIANLVPSASFRYKSKAKKRPWNTSNTEGIFFQNKLRNTWTATLKTKLLRLSI